MAVVIKHLADYSDKLRNVSNIVTETVGTTTSYTFPEDTLHPYIKRNLKEYIINHWEDEEIQEMVNVLRKQAKTEVAEGWVGAVSIPEGDNVDVKEVKEAVAEYALNQIDSSDLKVLKNRIVKDGYSKGQLQGHLFPDVLPAFKKWIAEGKKIFMYSSGLEMSQKCLVSNSVEGDITELISGCFYSSEFPRTRSESFREMCKKVDCSADKVAFLTDNAQTARAAHKAGLIVIMMCREGNSYVGSSIRESFPVINSFEDISHHMCGKRKMSGGEPEESCGKKPKLEESTTAAEEKKDEPTSPIDIVVTPPDEEKKTVKTEEKKDDSAEEMMEVDEKVEGEKAADEKEVVNGEVEVKEDTSKVEEVGKDESEAMETDGKVLGDKEQEKSEEKVEVGASKESEVKVEDKNEEEKTEVAKDGAEEDKSEEKVEESKPEEKMEEETKEKDAAKSKEEAKKEESTDEVKEPKTEETKSEETKSEEAIEKKPEETVEKKSEETVEKKSEEDVEKKLEKVEEKSGETIEEKKSEEEVSKLEEVEKKSEQSSEVKSAEEQGEEKKATAGEDEIKNNDVDGKSDEVIKENGDAEKEVCTNGIDREETKENGVSSDEKVEVTEAIKAVPKKAELEGSANEAAAQESA